MRFFAVILLFAFILSVSAVPYVASHQPSSLSKRTFQSLQSALDAWLNPIAKVPQLAESTNEQTKRDLQSAVDEWLHDIGIVKREEALEKRGGDTSAFGSSRNWQAAAKKYGLG